MARISATRHRMRLITRRSAVCAFIPLRLAQSRAQYYRQVEAGNTAFGAGRLEQALAAYNAAKQLTPNDPAVSYDLGNTLHRLERYEEAASASKSAATTTKDGVVYARATYALGSDAF